MAAILAVAEYLPASSKTKSANDPHLNLPLSSLTGDEGTHFTTSVLFPSLFLIVLLHSQSRAIASPKLAR